MQLPAIWTTNTLVSCVSHHLVGAYAGLLDSHWLVVESAAEYRALLPAEDGLSNVQVSSGHPQRDAGEAAGLCSLQGVSGLRQTAC